MKEILIKIFGKERLRYFKGIWIYFIKSPKFILKRRFYKNEKLVKNIEVYSIKGKNVFFGYYDLNPLKNDKLLVHSIKKYADTKKDKIDIGYFDINTHNYTLLTQSEAWCWQQGSRLRWSKEKDVIIYNDMEDGKYCTKYFDINLKKVIKTIPFALYDINADEEYGISVNFARLQRLRPGYGYDKIDDDTENDYFPKDDGVFLVDLKDNTKKLLVSLYDLAKEIEDYEKYEHYINHVSFSPNGKKVMFFHLYVVPETGEWRTRLCVFDITNNKLQILEKENVVSHYDWIDDSNLMVTTFKNNEINRDYRIYNLDNDNYKIIENEKLKVDGHPTYILNDTFISDTYPDDNCFQHLFKFDINNNKYEEILTIFSNPRLLYDKRCDLHPRVVKNGIIIDSAFKENKRSVVFIGVRQN